MKKTIVTAENFDSRNLFANINKESIADMFSDPDSDTVKSLNSRLRTVPLSSTVLDEIMASVEFANDDVAKDWCRFVGVDDADHATAASAQWWLRKNRMNSYELGWIVSACDEVAASKTFLKAGCINKLVCRMLRNRITPCGDRNTLLLIDNWGNAFTRDVRETRLLYQKMMRNPHWAERTFSHNLDWVSKYQWLQFQRLFGMPDISSAKEKLLADFHSALDSRATDEMAEYGKYRLKDREFIPVFSQNEVLPPAETVENALLYWHVLHECLTDLAYLTPECQKLKDFAYLYGNTDFSYERIQHKLNTSAELKQISEDNHRPSRSFGLLDLTAIDRISAELGIDVPAAEEFLSKHQYIDVAQIRIPNDADEAIMRAIQQDAEDAYAHFGPIQLEAYDKNLVARAEAEIQMPSEVALYAHWRPSANVMKAVIAMDKGPMTVFDLSGEALEKAFAESLAHAYYEYAKYPGMSAWVGGSPQWHEWLNESYLRDATDALNKLHEQNDDLRNAIAFPANE